MEDLTRQMDLTYKVEKKNQKKKASQRKMIICIIG